MDESEINKLEKKMRVLIFTGAPFLPDSSEQQRLNLIFDRFQDGVIEAVDLRAFAGEKHCPDSNYEKVIDQIANADAVFWAFLDWDMTNSYFCIQFIQHIREMGHGDVFRKKYSAILTPFGWRLNTRPFSDEFTDHPIDPVAEMLEGINNPPQEDYLHTQEKT